MLVLLTNDDGIDAEGLQMLRRELSKNWEVFTVAPKGEKSAASHSLTLHQPLKVERLDERTVSVDGTPTDCVMIAVHRLLHRRPDLIVSGINHGPNLGDDVTYSGTVAAAIEGTLLSIPSMAVSLTDWQQGSFDYAARFTSALVEKLSSSKMPEDTFLNVNVPDAPEDEIEGVRITRLGKRTYHNPVVEGKDPRGDLYYRIGGERWVWEGGDDTDFSAIERNMISITPLHLDLTNHKAIRFLEGWGYDSLLGEGLSELSRCQRADGRNSACGQGNK